MITRRTVLTALAAGVTATAAAGCLGDSADSPEGAGRLIARNLKAGTPSKGPITGAASDEAFAQITKGLGQRPSVSLVSISSSANQGAQIAHLRYTWDLGSDEKWEYEVEAPLVKAGERWTTQWAPTLVHPDLAADDELHLSTGTGNRGEILDRDGQALVTGRPVAVIGIDKGTIDEARIDSSARALARALGLAPDAYAKTVAAYGPKAFVEALTLRSDDLTDDKKRKVMAVPGARVLDEQRDLAPTKEFARAVLGTVAPVTAEQIKASKGRLKAGDTSGTGGLQEQYDAQLRGRRVTAIRAIPNGSDAGSTTRLLYKTREVDGRALRTTLSLDLQTRAEELLARHKDKPSALVAIQPSTGELVAVASGPGSKGYDTARMGRYAPGSTFKIVSSLALLRAGQSVDGMVNCTPTIQANGRSYHNFPDYPADKLGEVPFKTALANSCNTVMIRGAAQASASDLATAAESLGMTQPLGGLGYSGAVPAEDSGAEHDASMIGQGRLLASPLGMATVMASVAASHRITPVLVSQDKPKPPAPAKPLTDSEAQALRTLTSAVVTEGGGRILKDIGGPPALAKTGTAEYGTANPPSVHSWMVAAQGDIAVAVLIEDGGYGAVTCGPVVRDFLLSANLSD
ncbi:penicillin-binding protein [Dermacoccus sp. PAMC28757]|uniref:penicillin-binding transpeptidase domain-containing protein n=1 Tax=Dermacoccus sp. PAMC28757 TaxID=2762331 RepID=UPI00164E3D7D|nr:penicillin-binding transpeptidase domain-containing protein [Dermacoccus sp. PAMC28757]QNK51664.1 penicillin-binding protein [Dermacoccus sp. PAMC28757]